MVAVPALLIVTFPLVEFTVATAVLLDLNVTTPSVVFVSAFVNATSPVFLDREVIANLREGAAFAIVKVLVIVPV